MRKPHAMKTSLMNSFAALVAALLLAMPIARAIAADDHGHDHDEAPASSGEALPRFAAASERYELVGVLDGRRLMLWLDRAADNAPVTGAKIALQVAGATLEAEAHEDAYEVELAQVPAPGLLPVVATVTIGNETERLAGELDLHADELPAKESEHWVAYVGWGAGALAVLAAFASAARRLRARRQPQAGGAA